MTSLLFQSDLDIDKAIKELKNDLSTEAKTELINSDSVSDWSLTQLKRFADIYSNPTLDILSIVELVYILSEIQDEYTE